MKFSHCTLMGLIASLALPALAQGADKDRGF